MGKNSAIAWTDHTYNPWYGGCTSRGPECRECYVKRDMKRYGKNSDVLTRAKPTTFRNPLKWKDPAKIFVCSWSDFFLGDVPQDWREDAWRVMRGAPQHTYIIPTKRPGNIPEMLPFDWEEGWPNVWLLVSAGTQRSVDRWCPQLLEISAAVKGISIEPMLEAVDLEDYQDIEYYVSSMSTPDGSGVKYAPGLDWVIIGGESADSPHKARPFPVEAAIDLVKACSEASITGIPVFVKQMGTHWAYHTVVQDGKTAYQLGDRKGVRMEWWPEELQIQEFPV